VTGSGLLQVVAVSADSVSMASEVLAARRPPLLTLGEARCTGKLVRFHALLREVARQRPPLCRAANLRLKFAAACMIPGQVGGTKRAEEVSLVDVDTWFKERDAGARSEPHARWCCPTACCVSLRT